jgi:endonuclease/exonuclease/phosphatase family metal-dependent hydrolase
MHVVSLNVTYEPKIEEASPYHFFNRWPAIQGEISGADVIHLQEVHVSFLPLVKEFADREGYTMVECLYHTLRQMHLVTLVNEGQYVSHAVHSAKGTYSKALAVRVAWGNRTLFNVHLPLDIKNVGERMAATRAFVGAAADIKNALVLGDWNTLPGRGDSEQLEFAQEIGTIVDWDFGAAPKTTFWGYPHEEEHLRKYNSPAVLDRLWIGPRCEFKVTTAKCCHVFVEGGEMAIADHFPLHVHLR